MFSLLSLILSMNDGCAEEKSVATRDSNAAVAVTDDGRKAKPEGSELDWQSLYNERVYRNENGRTLPYRLMAPDGFHSVEEPNSLASPRSDLKSREFPLVLFLHGAGERGADNKKQLVHGAADFANEQRRKQHPCFVVFPQCPEGQRWVESDWSLPSGRGVFPDTPSEPMTLALELVDELVASLPVDKGRIYVTGLSMGGMGSWYAAASQPARFAAMLEVCGGGDPSWSKRYQGMPLWVFHGEADSVVPVSRAREMIRDLAESGHSPDLRYTEYPGVGHNSWTQTYKRDDVFDWLFSHQKR